DHAEAVVREAVSNVVRHAGATALTVSVTVEDDLVIEVVDNGRGIDADITGSGLTNLRRRAEELGGSFAVVASADGGTCLTWRAPLP
ncbi:sensor histidine kinase, partial [Mycolicibacterium poriferae]|uniref:sensor histidine kinase n=2 Tax=Mycolicibacterium TaxID=1866885 RepID=UPI00321BF779